MVSGIVKIRNNINGVANRIDNISGNIGGGTIVGYKQIFSDTTENWNAQLTLVSKKDCIYVYTDYKIEKGESIPAIKIGDGLAYLIDLPFTYMGNVSQEQIDFWNNKVSAYMDDVIDENLILSTN